MKYTNFGIQVGENSSREIVDWFKAEGYNINTMSGSANDKYVYYVEGSTYLKCDLSEKLKNIIIYPNINIITNQCYEIY